MTMMHIYVPFLPIVIYLFVASKCRNLIAISRWYRDGAHFDLIPHKLPSQIYWISEDAYVPLLHRTVV